MEAVRVTPGSNEEGRRRVGSYTEAVDQGWGCRPCESFQLGLQVMYLITELTAAAREPYVAAAVGTLQTTRPELLHRVTRKG